MATIGNVTLEVTAKPDTRRAVVEVRYDIDFDDYDRSSNQVYTEVCRLIGEDTHIDDPASSAPDDTLGFLTPMFLRNTRSDGKPSLSRHWTRTFHLADLNEDRGTVPDPDEIRAVVTLNPVPPSSSTRESNMVVLPT